MLWDYLKFYAINVVILPLVLCCQCSDIILGFIPSLFYLFYLFPRSGIWAIQPLGPFLIICFHLRLVDIWWKFYIQIFPMIVQLALESVDCLWVYYFLWYFIPLIHNSLWEDIFPNICSTVMVILPLFLCYKCCDITLGFIPSLWWYHLKFCAVNVVRLS